MRGLPNIPRWLIAFAVYGGVRYTLELLHAPTWAGFIVALLVTVLVFWLIARWEAKTGKGGQA